jgi:hypothetical protein
LAQIEDQKEWRKFSWCMATWRKYIQSTYVKYACFIYF